MGTLGAMEQFLVKARDNWSPDRSVCHTNAQKGSLIIKSGKKFEKDHTTRECRRLRPAAKNQRKKSIFSLKKYNMTIPIKLHLLPLNNWICVSVQTKHDFLFECTAHYYSGPDTNWLLTLELQIGFIDKRHHLDLITFFLDQDTHK